MGRVVVVGSVNIDLVVAAETLPRPGETVIGGRFAQHHGGKGGNQAVAAARLGASTHMVGAVGDDAFGEQARAALEAEGVDVGELRTVAGMATGVALILIDASGENLIAVASGANGSVTPADVQAALETLAVGAGDVVLVGLEIPPEAAREALHVARAAGATTILNPAPATGLTPAALRASDIVTPNEGELAVLAGAAAGSEVSSSIASLRAAGVPTALLVSLGATGSRLDAAGSSVSIAAPAVRAVDSVGAGDTLNGALAAGLASGLSLEDAARRAVAAASLSVTKPGAREGMPSLAELEAALRA